MNNTIVRLYYKENSKEPAVNEALIDLTQVSMIIRVGQHTVGMVVPGGWYEYSLVTDNLSGLEKTNRSAEKYIDLINKWAKLPAPAPEVKKTRASKTVETPEPKLPPATNDPWAEVLKEGVKPTPTLASPTARRELTTMADKMIAAGLKQPPLPERATAKPQASKAPSPMHNFTDASGLPMTLDLRDVITMSPYGDGTRKIRMGLTRGGIRIVMVPAKDGETFEDAYTSIYYKWQEIIGQ